MQARTRFARMVGVCVSVMGLVIVLGFTSPTLAQKEASAPKAEPDRVVPLPAVADVPPPTPPSIESIPTGGNHALEPPAVTASEPGKLDSSAVVAAQPSPAPASGVEDPEKAAQEFVERTRKEADSAIKSLTAEAEILRARLKKVESGLHRWQALHAALDQTPRKTAAGEKRAWKQLDGREPAPRSTARTIEAVPTEDLPLAPETARATPDRSRLRGEPSQRK